MTANSVYLVSGENRQKCTRLCEQCVAEEECDNVRCNNYIMAPTGVKHAETLVTDFDKLWSTFDIQY